MIKLVVAEQEATMPPPINFKELATSVDIEAVAQHLGVTLKGNRAQCPACQTDDPRSLQIYPETNSFHCWAAKVAGDAIGLWAHINSYQGQYRAAKELSEQFGTATAAPTAPQKPAGRTAPVAQPAAAFDPDAYLSKLAYTDEVSALGISQEDAEAIGIGYSSTGLHRGIAFALRWPSGEVAGFCSVISGELKMPKRLIPPKVVRLRSA